ncbi:MAG: cupin domain-containing protein [Candidatus Hermodarchaeota archaeon]
MTGKISLREKIQEIDDKPWSPIEVAKLNDQVIRIALFDGEYPWHKHTKEDELFYVYKGRIIIQFKDKEDILLNQGELAVVPKGVMHSPKSLEKSYILLFEPYTLRSRGD